MLNVDLSCDMDYYLNHRDELDKYLGRKAIIEVEEYDCYFLEKELFYKKMCMLFDREKESETDEIDSRENKKRIYGPIFSCFCWWQH